MQRLPMPNQEYSSALLRVLVLDALAKDGEDYGFSLFRRFKLKSQSQIQPKPVTIYQVLSRLAEEGLAQARWEEGRNGRHRRPRRWAVRGRGRLRH
jgi:DNA-binding PadR family transcriptional regulator